MSLLPTLSMCAARESTSNGPRPICCVGQPLVALGHGNKASILPIRGWTSEEWDAGVSRLVQRGWLHADGTFTEQGRVGREEIEGHTERLAYEPYRRLGAERTQRLIDVVAPYVEYVRGAGINIEWPPTHLLRRS